MMGDLHRVQSYQLLSKMISRLRHTISCNKLNSRYGHRIYIRSICQPAGNAMKWEGEGKLVQGAATNLRAIVSIAFLMTFSFQFCWQCI